MEYMLYPLIIIIPFLIKDQFIDKLISVTNQLVIKFEGPYGKGQRLYTRLLMSDQLRDMSGVPQYKFYNDLIFDVISHSNEYGTPLDGPMDTLKRALTNDLKAEKKNSQLIFSALGNFVAAAVVTWLFCLYATNALGNKLPTVFMVVMLAWHVLGVTSFLYAINRQKENTLCKFNQLFLYIYKFKLLCQSGVCVNEAIARSEIIEIFKLSISGLEYYHSRLEKIIENRIRRGEPIDRELTLFQEEIWSLYENRCERLKVHVTVMKFVWLCVFFLTSYLAVVYIVLNGMGV